MEPEEPLRPRFKSNFHDRKDDHSDKVERHISNLSEFLERGTISKKQPSSILKNSSTTSTQKSNKNYINEYQRKENRYQQGDGQKIQTVVLSDEDDDDVQKEKQSIAEKDLDDAKKAQLQAAEDDPNCPEAHVPLPESERLEALKLAQKRKSHRNRASYRNLIHKHFLFILGFKVLVDDLNRLPMTSETLRVRNRKIEIEKELRTLETNIRVFSRTKVYVKLD